MNLVRANRTCCRREDARQIIPEIDSLRAIAVSLVLLFHAYPNVVPGGFIGVDIFFVISGFVITRSYLFPLVANKTDLSSFYVARFRRLAPALFTVVAATTIAAFIILLPPDLNLDR